MVLEKNIKLLKWHTFFTDFTLWAPLGIIYFSKVSGSYALGISIYSIIMVSSAIFELPTGIFSDKFGRVKTFILGSLSYLLSGIFFAIGLKYQILIIGAIFAGLGRSSYSGNNDALLYDNLSQVNKKDDFTEYNGKIGSMSQIALGISAVIGGIIAYFSFSLLMWVSVIPLLICLFISLQLKEVVQIDKTDDNIFAHTKQALKNFLSNTKLKLISLSDIINFGLGEAGWNFRSAFITTVWPVWAIGIGQVLNNIGSAFSFHFSGKAIKKFKPINILIFKLNLNGVINLTSIFLANVFSPILMSLNSLFYGVGQVAKNKLLQDEFSDKQRATMGSLNSLAGSLFYSIFAVILGILADHLGPKNALLIQYTLGLSVLFLYFSLKKIIKNETA